METNKARRERKAAEIRQALRQLDPAATAIIELVLLMLQEQKDKLVDIFDKDELLRAQGAAKILVRLHGHLTTEPANIKPLKDNQEQ